jgi:hypothetical protein
MGASCFEVLLSCSRLVVAMTRRPNPTVPNEMPFAVLRTSLAVKVLVLAFSLSLNLETLEGTGSHISITRPNHSPQPELFHEAISE